MTHNVLIRQGNLPDALDTGKNSRCLHQAAALALRQVNLRHISRNNRLRAIPDTGQKHFHLGGRGILGLVKNDKGVIQRTASHISQRRYLDEAFLHIFREAVRPHDLIEGIVQRAKIRVYLALQVSRKKSQLLPCFNRRTSQNNTIHFIRLKCCNCLCHRKICLSGSRRSYTKYDHLIGNHINIFLLSHRFWLNRFPHDRMTDHITI